MKNKRHAFTRKLIGVGIVMSGLCLGLLAFGQSRDTSPTTRGIDYELSWSTVDGGGGMRSIGGDYELSGTIGQPDVGEMAGDGFTLSGGFWFQVVAGDCNEDAGVNLFDYDAFEPCLTSGGPAGGVVSPDCLCFDLDQNGTVDLLDFAGFQKGFSGS